MWLWYFTVERKQASFDWFKLGTLKALNKTLKDLQFSIQFHSFIQSILLLVFVVVSLCLSLLLLLLDSCIVLFKLLELLLMLELLLRNVLTEASAVNFEMMKHFFKQLKNILIWHTKICESHSSSCYFLLNWSLFLSQNMHWIAILSHVYDVNSYYSFNHSLMHLFDQKFKQIFFSYFFMNIIQLI